MAEVVHREAQVGSEHANGTVRGRAFGSAIVLRPGRHIVKAQRGDAHVSDTGVQMVDESASRIGICEPVPPVRQDAVGRLVQLTLESLLDVEQYPVEREL